MKGVRRVPWHAVAMLVGALGICMVRPVFDATCAMGHAPAGALGACGAAEAAFSRQSLVFALVACAIMAVVVLVSIGIHAVLHHRISRRLRRQARPAVVAGHAVGLVPAIDAAFVAGIRHPRIYCAHDLATRIDAEELRAVLLHERHHELVHAPARLVLLSALAPFVGRLGPGSAWLERQRARIEIAADEHAIGNGATRTTLARAILKLGDPTSRFALAGFATAGDLRLRALLGEHVGSTARQPGAVGRALATVAGVGVLCAILSIL